MARREYSRQELERKLAPLSQGQDQLQSVLDQLQSEGLLSDRRYAESIARVRGARYGVARVRYELEQKGVTDDVLANTLSALQESEATRLRQVWEKKFGIAPANAQDAARQQRFLMQRGFSSASISSLLRELQGR